MTNKKIGLLQLFTVTFFLSHSCYILFFKNIVNISKTDTIISIILGFLLDLILLKIILYIRKKVDITKYKVIRIPSIIILSSIFIYFLFSISNFIKSSFLTNGNIYSIVVLLILIVYISSIEGIKQVSSLSLILFYIFIPFFIINIIGSSLSIDFSYLKPFFSNSILNILKGTILFSFYTISPLLLILFIPYKEIDQRKKQDKYLYLALIGSNLVTIIMFLLLYFSCSINIITNYNYPYMLVINSLASNLVFDRFSYIISFYLLFDLIIILSILFSIIKQLIYYKYNQEK